MDRVRGLLGQLSVEQRKVLAGLIRPVMPRLDDLFDKVLAIPGVIAVLKPTIDTLKADLVALAA